MPSHGDSEACLVEAADMPSHRDSEACRWVLCCMASANECSCVSCCPQSPLTESVHVGKGRGS